MRRVVAVAALALAVTVPARAQVIRADSAFVAGDFARARTLYEQVLLTDSLNERALWRLALLDSWDNQLHRSLERFAKARRLDPANPDLMVAEAGVLSWAGRTGDAIILYDSALAQDTGRVDALAGRAQSVAWAGDLDRAEGLWRQALAAHPDDATLLVGLAQTLYWKGEPGLARVYVDRARAAAPGDAGARDLERILRAAVRPDVGASFNGAGDSDHENFYSQSLWISGPVTNQVRGTLTADWRHDTDEAPPDTATGFKGHRGNASYGVSGLASMAVSAKIGVRMGLGVRRVTSDSGDHTPITAQAGMSWQPASYAALALGYSRSVFDETAHLMERGLTLDHLEFSADLSPRPTVSISGGAGATWFSDGNRRLFGVLAALQGLGHGVSVGVFTRRMEYRTGGGGFYFAPDRFTVLEARAIYNLRRGAWGLRTDGGLGGQQINPVRGATGPWQSEWRLSSVLSYGWYGGEITLEGLYTNSAGSNTVGAFRYHSFTLGIHQGL